MSNSTAEVDETAPIRTTAFAVDPDEQPVEEEGNFDDDNESLSNPLWDPSRQRKLTRMASHASLRVLLTASKLTLTFHSSSTEKDYNRWWRHCKEFGASWAWLLVGAAVLVMESLNTFSGFNLTIMIILHASTCALCCLGIALTFYRATCHSGAVLPIIGTLVLTAAGGLAVTSDILSYNINKVPAVTMAYLWWLNIAYSTPIIFSSPLFGIVKINIIISIGIPLYAFLTSQLTTHSIFLIIVNTVLPLCGTAVIGTVVAYSDELLKRNTYLLTMLIAARQHNVVKKSEAQAKGLARTVSIHRNFEDDDIEHVTAVEMDSVIKNTTGWAGRFDDMGPFVLDQPRYRLSPYTLKFTDYTDLEALYSNELSMKPVARTQIVTSLVVVGTVVNILTDLTIASSYFYAFMGVRIGVSMMYIAALIATMKVKRLDLFATLIVVLDVALSVTFYALVPVPPAYEAAVMRSLMLCFAGYRLGFFTAVAVATLGVVVHTVVLPLSLSTAHPSHWWLSVFVVMIGLFAYRSLDRRQRKRLVLVKWASSIGHS